MAAYTLTQAQGKLEQEELCEVKASSLSSLYSKFQASQGYATKAHLQKTQARTQTIKILDFFLYAPVII